MSDSIFARLAVGRVLAEIRRQTLIRRGQRVFLLRLLDGDRATLDDRVAAEKWLAEHMDLPTVTTASQLLRSQNEAGSPGTAARDSQTL